MTPRSPQWTLSQYGDDAALLRRRAVLHGHLSELRLDLCPADIDLETIFHGLPWLATCLPEAEGGQFRGSAEEHSARLAHAAEAGAKWLDCPLSLPLPVDSRAAQTRWIHSCHMKKAEGGAKGILAHLRQRMRHGDVGKLVLWADTFEESMDAVSLQAEAGPDFIVFAQGPGGEASRLWSLALGAPWAYGCWPNLATAEGQIDVFSNPILGPAPRVFSGVIGKPISHSLSPLLWQAAYAQNGTPSFLAYARIEPKGALADLLRAIPQPSTPAVFSITTPFKEAAFQFADSASSAATAVSAANLLIRVQGGWVAHHTDGDGALNALDLQESERLLILGAGGSARAIGVAALERGLPTTFATRAKVPVPEGCRNLLLSKLKQNRFVFDAVVQATPVGSAHQPGNLLKGFALSPHMKALDLVYDPFETDFLAQAKKSGAQPISGLTILRHQAAVAMNLLSQELSSTDAAPFALSLRAQLLLERAVPSAQEDACLVLIGLRGSGKTTLGRALAQQLGFAFLDLDKELWGRHESRQRSIGIDSFAEWLQSDIAGFRKAESELFVELIHSKRCVLATGGGIIESSIARDHLYAHSRVMWLDAPSAVCQARCSHSDRPALTSLSPEAEWACLYEERQPLYAEVANRRVPTEGNLQDSVALLHEAKRSFD